MSLRAFAFRIGFCALGAATAMAAEPEKPALPAPVGPSFSPSGKVVESAQKPVESPEKAVSLGEQITVAIKEITAKSAPAICRIEADDEHGRISGTGFVISEDGIVITSYSLGNAAEEMVVDLGGVEHDAVRLVADSRSGIALLKVNSTDKFRPLKLAPNSKPEIGTPVLALGFPLELPLSPSFGVVAGFNSGFQGRYFAAKHLRVNAQIQHGEGGAPLLNLDGEVIGVLVSAVEGGSGLFALPIEGAMKVLEDYKSFQKVRPGWLGADVRSTEAPAKGSTARLRSLRPDGPGAKAGLRAGDVLLQVGKWEITNPEDVLNAAFYMTATKPVEVRVARGTRMLKLEVIPGDPPVGEVPQITRQAPTFLGANGEEK